MSEAAYACYLCDRPILGLMTNWKGHNVHPQCSVACMSAVVDPTPGCLAGNAQEFPDPNTRKEAPQIENTTKRVIELTRINDIFRKRLRDDPDTHMLSLARTLKLEGFTWCRVVTEIIGRIKRAEKKLEEIGYRRNGEHWLQSDDSPNVSDGCDHEGFKGGCERAGHTVETCPHTPQSWKKQTVFIDPAFAGADKTIAGVLFRFPAELVGPECPDAGNILKEIQHVAELLLTKNRAYGSSFRTVMGVFSKLSPVDAINARMDDKLARVKQAKDFSEDTELDLIGYLILKRVLLRETMKAEETAEVNKPLNPEKHSATICGNTTANGYWCQRASGHTGPCAFVPPVIPVGTTPGMPSPGPSEPAHSDGPESVPPSSPAAAPQ